MSSPGTLAFALTGSLLAFASTASAQTPDTFQRMNAGYAAAMGRPAGGPTAPFLRVSAEVLGGALAGAAGGGVGLLVGGLACGFDALSAVGASTSSCTGRLPVGIFAPAFLGAAVGTAVAVPLLGDRYDGTGRWWGSSLGVLAGSALGVAIVSQVDLDWRASSAIFVSTTTVGAVLGYELSAAFAPATAPTAASGRRVAPVAAITPAGAHFGLAGTF